MNIKFDLDIRSCSLEVPDPNDREVSRFIAACADDPTIGPEMARLCAAQERVFAKVSSLIRPVLKALHTEEFGVRWPRGCEQEAHDEQSGS
jgi:hypothetical protein